MQKNLRINFLLPHFGISGGVKAAMEYANRLHRLGHDVRLISTPVKRRGINKYLPFLENKERNEVNADSVKWFPLECKLYALSAPDPRLMPEADIHIATCWETAEIIHETAKISGKGFYLVQHHEVTWAKDKNRAAATYRLPLEKFVISSWLKEIMKKEYNCDSTLIVTPVNHEHFYPDGEPSPLRICTLHHHYDWKGIPDAIEAIKIAQQEIPDLRPVLFSAQTPTYEEYQQQFDLPCEFHYKPSVEKLRKLYSSSSIFLCSSWVEGLGMPAMEAMACGSALVTTDTGGSWDYAVHNETALVSAPKDPQTLAKNIVKVVKDAEIRQKLAQKGQERIKEFTWDGNVTKMIDCFTNS